eukprot:413087-Amphidinium_carterae.1
MMGAKCHPWELIWALPNSPKSCTSYYGTFITLVEMVWEPVLQIVSTYRFALYLKMVDLSGSLLGMGTVAVACVIT